MKRIAAIALLATATLMTAGRANAQSDVLKVNVPFNFTVDRTFLPAGNYAFGFDSIGSRHAHHPGPDGQR
jgi:hypothetical protein